MGHKEKGFNVEGLNRKDHKGKGLIDMSISPSEIPAKEGEQVDVQLLLNEILKSPGPSFQRRNYHSKAKR